MHSPTAITDPAYSQASSEMRFKVSTVYHSSRKIDPTEACLLSCTSVCDPVNWLEKHKEWQRDCIMDTAPQVSPLPRSRQKARVQGAWPWKVTPYLWIALSDSQHRNCCLFLYLGWRKNCSLSIPYPHVEPAQSQTSLFTFQMALTVLRPDSPAFLKCVLQWH